MTDDIVNFIRARLDEDRAAADEMQENANWMSDCGEPHNVSIDLRSGWEMDKARVLRGVEAKRRILDEWQKDEDRYQELKPKRPRDQVSLQDAAACCGTWGLATRLVASEWSTHPAYRTEWTP